MVGPTPSQSTPSSREAASTYNTLAVVGAPMIPPRAFISYARKDGEAFATALRERLQRDEPEITLWQDRARMEGGVGWWKQITDALDQVRFMILVVTPASLESDTVQKEWRYARQQGVCLCPINAAADKRLPFDQMPKWMSTQHFYDLDKQWQVFVNQLKSPCLIPRVPFMAPDLPAHSVERAEPLKQLVGSLLDETTCNPIATNVAIYGAGGFGKTTLAAQICHNDDITTAFVDGIFWATLGEKPNVLAELTKLYAALTGDRPAFVNVDDAAVSLDRVLADRHCLIVIDDVWQVGALVPFMRGGEECARLITTRQLEIAVSAGGKRISIDQMTGDEATSLLTNYVDGQTVDRTKLASIAQRMGEWPILLELAGGALRQRLARGDSMEGALAYLNLALDKGGITVFDRKNPTERSDAVSRTVGVSLDLLEQNERDQYRAFAVFPEDAAVPVSAVRTLLGLDDFDVEKLLDTLDGLSLIKLDLKTATVRLHDVMRAYLASELENAWTLHARLADAWSTPDQLHDAYAWRYAAYHMSQAIAGSPPEERHARTKQLVELVTSTAFREGHARELGDLPSLRRDVECALRCAGQDIDPDAPILSARAALALSTLVELEPEQLFALASEGKLDKAEAVLALFDPDFRWRDAALLLLAWQAAIAGQDASAQQLLARLTREIPAADQVLQSLLLYVRAATQPGVALPPPALPAPPDLYTVTAIMQRLGGTSVTPIEPLLVSGLRQSGDNAPVFLAEHDGPLLVAFAKQDPANATYMKQYIAAHASNPYRYYRDRSLWGLIPSILQCDVPALAFPFLYDVTAGALAPTRIEFRWALSLALLGVRASRGDGLALQALEADRQSTLQHLNALSPTRGEGDPWAHVLRRLVALGEVYASVLGRPADAIALLDSAAAMGFEYNFAGFRAPACLTLAEGLLASSAGDGSAIERALDAALTGAQNIQDAEFCAQTCARVNAVKERWWSPAHFDLVICVNRLTTNANDPLFAAIHRVGDMYDRRTTQTTRLPLPPSMFTANTLRTITQLYPSMRSVQEQGVLAFNPHLGLAAVPNAFDEPLADGTVVNIIDPDFAPLLAARFAAEVLSTNTMPAAQRSALIQRLVPIAAPDATALDLVLARMMMTTPVVDITGLEPLRQVAEEIAHKVAESSGLSATALAPLFRQHV